MHSLSSKKLYLESLSPASWKAFDAFPTCRREFINSANPNLGYSAYFFKRRSTRKEEVFTYWSRLSQVLNVNFSIVQM